MSTPRIDDAAKVLTEPTAYADEARLHAAATPRGGEVVLVAAMEGSREIELKLPGRYRLDATLRGALKTAPGVMMLEDA